MSTDGTERNIEIVAAPRNGSTRRLVVAMDGEQELLRDNFNTDDDRERRRYLRRLEQAAGAAENEFDDLASEITRSADAADEGVEQAARGGNGSGRSSQADQLVGIAQDAELFHNAEGECYASINVDGHVETHGLRRKRFRQWLSRQFFQQHRKAPGSQAVSDAMNVLEGRAAFEGDPREVFARLASHDDAIFVDLVDESWRAIRITGEGWDIVDTPPVRFRRAGGMLALPEPQSGGSLADLRQFVNVRDEDWPLLLGWLVAAARPSGPFPVLVVNGEQGTAKSTMTRVLRDLIDPNKAPLRSEPRNPHDLMIAATNAWVIALDNMSYIKPWLSDALCRLATGGGFATRELYTDGDEVLFDAQRPVILNGIEELAQRSDLLQRSLILTLDTIPDNQRRTESEFKATFQDAYPRLLGALFDAVAAALRNLPSVSLDFPRMADFAEWAVAAEPAMGIAAGAFLQHYAGNRDSANSLVLERSPVAQALVAFIGTQRDGSWSGTATSLLSGLHSIVSVTNSAMLQTRSWPRGPGALSNALRRIVPNLREVGITVDFQHSGDRTITITRTRSAGLDPAINV